MPPQKSNPFEIIPASSTSQISPSPARNSVKSHGSQHRLSMSAGRNARSVSFAGSSKPGARELETAPEARAMLNERVTWQNLWNQRFLELPQVDPKLHTVSVAPHSNLNVHCSSMHLAHPSLLYLLIVVYLDYMLTLLSSCCRM